MSEYRRIGLFGGTFDPIHFGHLVMAENAMEQLGLERVVFAPAGNPPHKPDNHLAPVGDRVSMIEQAIAGRPGFECSRIDADRDEPAFTWQLLERFGAVVGESRIVFIMGGDSLADFAGWSRPERILELAEIAVVERPGYSYSDVDLQAVPGLADRLHIVEAPLCSISSTEIRSRVGDRRTIRYLVPEPIRHHIDERSLYARP